MTEFFITLGVFGYIAGWLYTTFLMARQNIYGIHLDDDVWELTKALSFAGMLWWLILPVMIIRSHNDKTEWRR